MEALLEVKSTEAANVEVTGIPLTIRQERVQAQKMFNLADKFDEKAGVRLPSIKQKIENKGKSQSIKLNDDDSVSLASILIGSNASSESRSRSKSVNITNKIHRETERISRSMAATNRYEITTLLPTSCCFVLIFPVRAH